MKGAFVFLNYFAVEFILCSTTFKWMGANVEKVLLEMWIMHMLLDSWFNITTLFSDIQKTKIRNSMHLRHIEFYKRI